MRSSLALLLALVGACQDLPRAEPGECGNGVVEATLGEDCEPLASADCGAVGTAAACRWTCATGLCPDGWACVDGLCHHGVAALTEIDRRDVLPGFPLHGDVNHDGFTDLATTGPYGTEVRLGSGLGFPSGTVLALGATLFPTMADLDADELDDIAAGTGFGLFVVLGTEAGSLVPNGYPTFDLGAPISPGLQITELRPLGVQVNPALGPAEELAILGTLSVASPPSQSVILGYLADDRGMVVIDGASSLDDLASVDVRDIDGWFGEEILVAVQTPTTSAITIYAPQLLGFSFNSVATLTPAPGQQITAARFAEVDGDNLVDVIVAVKAGGTTELLVATGAGGYAALVAAPALPADLRVLAIADLNDDGRDDLVSQDTVYVSCLLGWCERAHAGEIWTEAVVGDFNGDGVPDIAAGTARPEPACASGEIDPVGYVAVLYGDGSGWFSDRPVLLDAPLGRLAAGDFNGDLVDNLLGVQPVLVGEERKEAVVVLYGQPLGPFHEPATMGRFGFLASLAVVVTETETLTDQRADAVAVVQRCEGGTPAGLEVTLFFGMSDNVLLAPYVPQSVTAFDGALIPSVHASPGAGAEPDLILTSVEVTRAETTCTGSTALWRLAGQPGALFSHGNDELYPAPGLTANPGCTIWDAADLDGDGVVEVVALGGAVGKPLTAHTTGTMLVAPEEVEIDGLDGCDAASLWVAGLGAAPGSDAVVAETPLTGAGVSGATSLRLLDVDGDLAGDFVLAFHGDAAAPGPVLLRWGAGGAVGADETRIDLPAAARAFAATALNVDADPLLELAVLTSEGIYLVDQTAARTFAAPELAAPAGTPPAREVVLLTRLDAFDVDGDGLADLVASDGRNNERVRVLRQISHLEEGASTR